MADENPETVAVDHLRNLGLSKYEAKTLVNLLKLGTGTAQDITRVNDVPRTRVYEAAEGLHERGLIDIQRTTPRKFTILSAQSIIRRFNVERERMITELTEAFDDLGPVEPQHEQHGVWTVTGRGAISDRLTEFMREAEEQVILMTIDDLLTEDILEALGAAAERDVTIYVAGISDQAENRIVDVAPEATLFETLWAWEDTPAARLLVTDQQTALVSAIINDAEHREEFEETAIWGAGDRNSLVVILRLIFTWRLQER